MAEFHKPRNWTEEEIAALKKARVPYADNSVWRDHSPYFKERERIAAENRAYFGVVSLTRWQRIKRRVRKAFWFLFRDEE